jgi:hypothetical protein
MFRALRMLMFVTLAGLAVPTTALAEGTRFSSASFEVHLAVSFIGLGVAIFLLIEALAVRKLAMGGAVANKMGLVVLAVICLSASALAEWSTNFIADLSLEQAQLASEVLVIVAMALLAAYFNSVGAGMRAYMTAITQVLQGADTKPATDSDEEADRA